MNDRPTDVNLWPNKKFATPFLSRSPAPELERLRPYLTLYQPVAGRDGKLDAGNHLYTEPWYYRPWGGYALPRTTTSTPSLRIAPLPWESGLVWIGSPEAFGRPGAGSGWRHQRHHQPLPGQRLQQLGTRRWRCHRGGAGPDV